MGKAQRWFNLDWEAMPSSEYSQTLVNTIDWFNGTIAFLDIVISETICNVNWTGSGTD